ncbi:MAG: ATP-grasp domain-containing protein, partial [Deltaproteobacteria bacterium]|nr:ATP-grasp domain-containing protein [Candidatus Zymogenus saltonus]
YGFLAENADFAKRCEEAKIVFIGPPAGAIRDLGDKTVARRMMIEGGVPVIPGMTEPEADPKEIAKEAEKIGYPVIIKAAAGGGGKGMRIVNSKGEIEEAANQATSEAKTAFGNGAIYLEKYIERPRHIEFQVLADKEGNTVHIFERECSIQRRHQKIIEETPSTFLTPELRDEMGRAAVSAAKAAGYVNAGTVEFIVDANGNFYFLEVNTRLQVEHPVTEMVTGLDLVRKQVEIAAGLPLGMKQEEIRASGHAIEARIYAEDPENSFFPSVGNILFMKEPTGPGVRVDSGIYSGFTVPMEYDPILAKLVVFAGTRGDAIRRMVRALKNYPILGIKTPVPMIIDIISSKQFQDGETYTDFIEANFKDWRPLRSDADAAVAAYIIDEMLKPKRGAVRIGDASEASIPTPWETLGGWRMA